METDTFIDSHQYLTFKLEQETFALSINKVREVMDYTHITQVPRMPSYLKGVINLRGNVVPVVDLRLILGMDAIEKSVDTCVIIAEIEIEKDTVLMGALADSVQEVLEITPESIQPPMKLGTKLNTDFIKGMGKHGEDFLIILDIDKALSETELNTVLETQKNLSQNK